MPDSLNTPDIQREPPRQWRRKAQYSFDNFLVNESNRAAYEAAQAATSSPGQVSNNPLLIYGGIGLGKTHLLQAIANQLTSDRPQAKVSYLHCERFVADVVRAYQTNKLDGFKDWYLNLDLLLIDDSQYISGKPKSQEELTMIVETLLESDKQVVFSADQHPQGISAIHPKLASLLQAGNVIVITHPEIELRTAIVTRELRGLLDTEPQEEVATFVAQLAPADIRKLLGATKRVCAQTPSAQALNLEVAKQILDDLIQSQNAQA